MVECTQVHEGRRSVHDVLADMAEAVRRGEMKRAAQMAHSGPVPLAVQPAELGIFSGGIAQSKAGPRLIAKGAQGQVMRCHWDGADVAVKIPRLGTTADMERFRREVASMATLGGPKTHIMPLLGARCLPPHYLLVMPLAGQSLAQCMYVAAPAWRPCWHQVLSVGMQLAQALATMHAAGVVHRDLKPDNVLLQLAPGQATDAVPYSPASVQVYLSDLGLASHITELQAPSDKDTHGRARGRMARPTGGFHKANAVGTQEYCAPELLMHSAPHSPASDVFALAVTLNELTTLTPPYSDCTRDGPPGLHTVLDTGYTRQQLAAAVAGEGLRPRPPMSATPPGWLELLDAAWATDAQQRPSAAQLLAHLQHLAESVLPAWEAAQQQQQQLGAVMYTQKAQMEATDMDVDVDETPRPSDMGSRRQQEASSNCLTISNSSDGSCPTTAAEDVMEQQRVVDQDQEWEQWAQAVRAAGARVWDFAVGSSVSPQASGTAGAMSPTVTAGVVEAVGLRDTWEDRSVVETQLDVPLPATCPTPMPPVSVLAVFDGHRGAEAAELCARRAAPLVAKQLAAAVSGQCQAVQASERLDGELLAQVVRKVLLQLEQEYFSRWDAERRAASARAGTGGAEPGAVTATAPARLTYPGCTATLAVIVGSTLTVGNLGDGRAVLGGSCGVVPPLCLNRPHTAGLAYERARLQAQGSPAVWHEQGGGWRLPGCGLQVTRSIGDYDAKGLQPTPLPDLHDTGSRGMLGGTGLTAEPEVCQVHLQAHHTWLVLGSDGLWDVLQPSQVDRFVNDTVKHPAMSARRLVAEALDAGSTDNISALVAFLQPVTTLERVYTAQHVK